MRLTKQYALKFKIHTYTQKQSFNPPTQTNLKLTTFFKAYVYSNNKIHSTLFNPNNNTTLIILQP